MKTFSAGFLFCGLGAGARGFLDAAARLGADRARFRSLGGIDIDPDSCRDFEYLTGSRATVADLSTMTPSELLSAWGRETPDCVFLSPPCKGFSGLLSNAASQREKYQALNRLVLQGLFLLCEAYDPSPPLIVLENVPRIQSRGAALLDQVRQLLRQYGYVFHEATHDCGEIGGLAQHRRRYLLVARRPDALKAYVYRPPLQRVKACGEVIGPLPMPQEPDAGELHLLPRISWLNWVRLALIPAGGDWRDLPGVVPAGQERRSEWARYDVRSWREPARTVAGSGTNGGFAVADPRTSGIFRGSFGVIPWEGPAPTIRGAANVRTAPAAIADPRLRAIGGPNVHHNKYRVQEWNRPTGTVIGATRPGSGAGCVADPRLAEVLSVKGPSRPNLFGVGRWDRPALSVTGSASISGSNGVAAVADPRVEEIDVSIGCRPRGNTKGPYGVLSWEQAAGTVTGSARIDNGAFAIADPRRAPDFIPVIVAEDETWHRPLTTLELAVLQGIPSTIGGRPLQLAGRRIAAWRERIGNAVPVGAARAIAETLLKALLAGSLGTWFLSNDGIWVRRRDGVSEVELGNELGEMSV